VKEMSCFIEGDSVVDCSSECNNNIVDNAICKLLYSLW